MFIGRSDVEAKTLILWPPEAKSWFIGKDPDAEKDWGQEEKGTTDDEMVGWHHRLNGHEFGWAPGVGVGQRGLVCCSSWGRRFRHDWVTELTELNCLLYVSLVESQGEISMCIQSTIFNQKAYNYALDLTGSCKTICLVCFERRGTEEEFLLKEH